MSFQKGYTPWNKGKVGVICGAKKGHIPWNKQEGIKKICETCGLEFSVPICWNYRKFCSQKCYGQSRKGKNIWNKGKKSFYPAWNKGMSLSINTRNKISKAQIGRIPWNKGKLLPQFSRENHPNWKGGSSFIAYPLGWNKTFKEQIRYRDGYKCQMCGVSETECKRKLSIHHIDYNKNNLAENNLISLCHSCHSKTNYKSEKWIQYFKFQEVKQNGS